MKSKIFAIISLGITFFSLTLIMAFRQNSSGEGDSQNRATFTAGQHMAPFAIRLPNLPDEGVKPANLLFFEAEQYGTEVLLLWDAVHELELVGFQVERAIGNHPFERIGWVYCREISQEPFYEFTDSNHFSGESCFYRLKMVNFDGTETYSPVIMAPEVYY